MCKLGDNSTKQVEVLPVEVLPVEVLPVEVNPVEVTPRHQYLAGLLVSKRGLMG